MMTERTSLSSNPLELRQAADAEEPQLLLVIARKMHWAAILRCTRFIHDTDRISAVTFGAATGTCLAPAPTWLKPDSWQESLVKAAAQKRRLLSADVGQI